MMKSIVIAVSALLVLASPATATGRYKCETVSKEDWLSKEALTKMLTGQGWSVRFMKEDGGCWEVYGTTPEGQRVEAYFHPSKGTKLLVAQRGKILFRAKEK